MPAREHSRQYVEYLQSMDWLLRRQQELARAGEKCERCGAAQALEVHHLTYEHLGDEQPGELLVVCHDCHAVEDRLREQREHQRAAGRSWDRRLDGWATKVYGEDWEYEQDPDAVEEAFEQWLEDRGE